MRRPKPQMSSPTEVARVEAIAPSGLGLVRSELGAVFVPLTAPGDLIELEHVQHGRSHARLVRLIEAGPGRVTPACPAFGRCGGCDFMHLGRNDQLATHVELLRSTMPLGDVEVKAVQIDPALGYRTRVRLHGSGRGSVKLGYFAAGSHELVDRDECAVLDPRLVATLPTVRKWLALTKGGSEITLALQTVSDTQCRPVATLRCREEPAPALLGRIHTDVEAGQFAGVAVALPGASKDLVVGDPRPCQLASDGLPLWFPPFGFAQASDHGARLLADVVAEYAQPEGKHVAELYAGSGTISVRIAPLAASFVAIEEDPLAVESNRQNLAARGITAKVSVGNAEQARLSPKTEVVVLDPPRKGAAAALAGIVRARPAKIIYVSCDAATLSRDARLLEEYGYSATRVAILEMFPQTTHVETVALFRHDARLATRTR